MASPLFFPISGSCFLVQSILEGYWGSPHGQLNLMDRSHACNNIPKSERGKVILSVIVSQNKTLNSGAEYLRAL